MRAPLTHMLLAGLLLGAPCAGVAQTFPRYYVGLAAYSSDYQGLGGGYNRGVRVPVQVVAGYQFRPRLAVQLGVAYSSSSSSYFGMSKYYTGSAAAASPYAYFMDEGQSTTRNTSVALLARYSLTRQAAHRFQVDVLGGFTLERQRLDFSSTRTDADSTNTHFAVTQTQNQYRRTDLLVTAGLSPRFRFSRHLEAVLDVTLNKALTIQTTRFTGATALGLRYRFGGLR